MRWVPPISSVAVLLEPDRTTVSSKFNTAVIISPAFKLPVFKLADTICGPVLSTVIWLSVLPLALLAAPPASAAPPAKTVALILPSPAVIVAVTWYVVPLPEILVTLAVMPESRLRLTSLASKPVTDSLNSTSKTMAELLVGSPCPLA